MQIFDEGTEIMNLQKLKVLRLSIRVQYDTFAILMKILLGLLLKI